MQQRQDVARRLEAWHEDAYAPPAPAYLSQVLERTSHTRQRPAWASLERWLPMKLTSTASAAPRALRPVWILLIVLALVIAVAGLAIIGGRLLAPAPALPLGGAAVIAFASDAGDQSTGDIYTVRADGDRPAPADECFDALRRGPGPRVVARWHAHRLPRIPGRQTTRSR